MGFRASEEEIVFIEPHPAFVKFIGTSLVVVGAASGIVGGFMIEDQWYSLTSFILGGLLSAIIATALLFWLFSRGPAAERVALDHRGLVCSSSNKTQMIIPIEVIKGVGVLRGSEFSQIRLWYDESAYPEPPAMVRYLRKQPGELQLVLVGDGPGFIGYENVSKIREFVQRHKIEWRNRRTGAVP